VQHEERDERAALAAGKLLGEVAAAAADLQPAEQGELERRGVGGSFARAADEPCGELVMRGFGEHARRWSHRPGAMNVVRVRGLDAPPKYIAGGTFAPQHFARRAPVSRQ